MCCIILVQVLHFGNLQSVDTIKDFIEVLNGEIWITCQKKFFVLKTM